MSLGSAATEVLGLAERTLRSSWIEGERDGAAFAYSRPSPGHYFWQWYWDSCFHAIVWRRFAPERAEARARLAAERRGRDDGFIGHTIFWNRPVDLNRRWTYNVTSGDAKNTSTIQPPLLAWAWRIAVGDPADEPRIAAHHRWLEEHRDLDGDGLLWIVQPDESGLDSSPKFDPVWGRRAHAHLGFIALIQRNRKRAWDAAQAARRRGPAAVRGCRQRPLGPCEARRRRAVDHAGPGGSSLGREARPFPRCGARRHRASQGNRPIGSGWDWWVPLSPPGPRLPRWPCPTSRGDRPPAGGRAPAQPEKTGSPVPPTSVSSEEPASSPASGRTCACAATGGADLDQFGLAALPRAAPPRLRHEADHL